MSLAQDEYVDEEDQDNFQLVQDSLVAVKPEPDADSTDEKKIEKEVILLLEIEKVQWFLIKNKERKELASGAMQVMEHPDESGLIVFTFSESETITFTSTPQQTVMKVYDRDYVFACSDDFFGLYIDVHVDQIVADAFEEILKRYITFRVSSRERPLHNLPVNIALRPGPPSKIALMGLALADLIRAGTVHFARGTRTLTSKATLGIQKSSKRLIDKIEPNEKPTKVNPKLKNGLAKAKIAGGAVVKVTGALVTGTIAAVNALANEISDGIAETEFGQKLSNDPGPKTRAAKELLRSSIGAAATIYDEVISSTVQLVSESSAATAKVVGHKYGQEMGETAADTASVLTNTTKSLSNVSKLGTRAIAKRIAKTTAVETLRTDEEKVEARNNSIQLSQFDAVKSLQLLSHASELSDMYDEERAKKKLERQHYIGIDEGVQIGEEGDMVDVDVDGFREDEKIGVGDDINGGFLYRKEDCGRVDNVWEREENKQKEEQVLLEEGILDVD